MKKEKLEVYKIILHPEIKLIEVIWRGAFTSEEFREGNEEMLYELRLKGISKVIVDMENVVFSVSQTDHEWFKNDYVPRAIEADLKAIAFIEPGLFNTLSIANLLYPYFPAHINFEIFENFEEASKWLIDIDL